MIFSFRNDAGIIHFGLLKMMPRFNWIELNWAEDKNVIHFARSSNSVFHSPNWNWLSDWSMIQKPPRTKSNHRSTDHSMHKLWNCKYRLRDILIPNTKYKYEHKYKSKEYKNKYKKSPVNCPQHTQPVKLCVHNVWNLDWQMRLYTCFFMIDFNTVWRKGNNTESHFI